MVEKEGPIHKEVVKSRIADLLHVRLGSRISQRLDNAILDARIKKYINVNGDFLWPINMEHVNLRVYQGGDYKRSIEEIPPQEVSLAIFECVKNSISISEDDLIKETARLFGLKATANVSMKIQWIIRSMITNTHLKQKAGKIMMGNLK